MRGRMSSSGVAAKSVQKRLKKLDDFEDFFEFVWLLQGRRSNFIFFSWYSTRFVDPMQLYSRFSEAMYWRMKPWDSRGSTFLASFLIHVQQHNSWRQKQHPLISTQSKLQILRFIFFINEKLRFFVLFGYFWFFSRWGYIRKCDTKSGRMLRMGRW